MRRALEVAAIAVTAVILVATSRSPEQCATENMNVRAETTCGAIANMQVSVNTLCNISTVGADFASLPASGRLFSETPDAGLQGGYTLSGDVDGGSMNCNVRPVADGGSNFEIFCTPTCPPNTLTDGGVFQAEGCPPACSGSLIPQF